MADPVVLGIGNRDRGDDAVGLLVLDELAARGLPGVDLMAGDGDPGWMLDAWEGRPCAVVVDAMVTGAAPGTVVSFDASSTALPSDARLSSSHALGAATSVELARALGRLPKRLFVIGVEAGSVALGSSLSPAVATAVGLAADAAMEVLADA
ncbi:MAG: hydrogenase maturation protease [Acidimicrobiia bacterium]